MTDHIKDAEIEFVGPVPYATVILTLDADEALWFGEHLPPHDVCTQEFIELSDRLKAEQAERERRQ